MTATGECLIHVTPEVVAARKLAVEIAFDQ